MFDVMAIFIATGLIAVFIVKRAIRYDGNSKIINNLLKPVHIKDKII